MGYTHYWERPEVLPRPRFLAAVADCRRLCAELKIPLGNAFGPGKPIFNASQICFNGTIGPEGNHACETFYVERVCQSRRPEEQLIDGWWRGFCKTNHCPYDRCVQGCLIVLSRHLPFRVTSDGKSQEWNEARAACQRILGYGIDWGEGSLVRRWPSS